MFFVFVLERVTICEGGVDISDSDDENESKSVCVFNYSSVKW